jgi:DNA primase small subunit
MPHSITPDLASTDDIPRTMSQATIEAEHNSEDISVQDAPSLAEADTTKAGLESLFDDDVSDQDFPSSAPVQSEQDQPQPTTLYATPTCLTSHY